MLRRLAIASFALTAACAGGQKPAEAAKKTTTEERMRITNQPPFDLASCFPREVKLPQQTSEGVVLGALLATRPEVLECLVDPKHRGPAPTTKVQVKTTVTDQTVTHAVSGENLTPEGQACIQKFVDAQVQPALLAKGAKPVEATIPFELTASGLNSVTFGINEGSDYAGTVRLAQENWCDCFAPFKDGTPPVLTAKVKLVKDQPSAVDITFDPSGNTEGDQLATCLKTNMAPLPAKLTSNELTFPHRFVTYNSRAPETAAENLPVELRFLQLDLVRTQRAADAAVADGERGTSAAAYVEVVERYQKTKDWRLFDELESKCNALVKADTTVLEALKARQAVEQVALNIATEQKTKDAAWAEAEVASQKSLTDTQTELTAAEKALAQDKGACPKKNYKK